MSGNCKTAAIPTTSGNGNQLNNNNGARSQDIYALKKMQKFKNMFNILITIKNLLENFRKK